MSFRERRREAIAKGVKRRDAFMAIDDADLRALVAALDRELKELMPPANATAAEPAIIASEKLDMEDMLGLRSMEDTVTVRVQTAHGMVHVDVLPSDVVASTLCGALGIENAGRPNIRYKGIVVSAGATFADYGIEDGAQMSLVVDNDAMAALFHEGTTTLLLSLSGQRGYSCADSYLRIDRRALFLHSNGQYTFADWYETEDDGTDFSSPTEYYSRYEWGTYSAAFLPSGSAP